MRNNESGWVRDKILVRPEKHGKYSIRVLNENTSPTNIALDLINQLGKIQSNPKDTLAQRNIENSLRSLERASYHYDSGLFYSWYSTAQNVQAVQQDVSSVDNIHLALALWTIRETHPASSIRSLANRLFERMDFSVFYDRAKNLMGGNLKHQNGAWTLEAYRFANLGSEARSIYSLCWALGLLKKNADPDFAAKTIYSLKAEFYRWKTEHGEEPILRTWDGGAFQLLLPKLLASEEKYSNQLAQSFKNYADFVVEETKRQGLKAPAAHSASNLGIDDGYAFGRVPSYNGNAGSPALVSTDHAEVHDPRYLSNWDLTYTPHAAIMAATADPEKLAPFLVSSEKLRSGRNVMYLPGLGFMDGYHLKGPYQGQVVPVQLSLDQGMIALALDQMMAPDGMSPSARALSKNPAVREKLAKFYKLLDQKLSQLQGK